MYAYTFRVVWRHYWAPTLSSFSPGNDRDKPAPFYFHYLSRVPIYLRYFDSYNTGIIRALKSRKAYAKGACTLRENSPQAVGWKMFFNIKLSLPELLVWQPREMQCQTLWNFTTCHFEAFRSSNSFLNFTIKNMVLNILYVSCKIMTFQECVTYHTKEILIVLSIYLSLQRSLSRL